MGKNFLRIAPHPVPGFPVGIKRRKGLVPCRFGWFLDRTSVRRISSAQAMMAFILLNLIFTSNEAKMRLR